MEEGENTGNGNMQSLNSPVSESESGQKLLRFLERRLGLPESLLHRWVRTGQIRVNGKRCKPFERLDCGDLIRIPPFAQALAGGVSQNGNAGKNPRQRASCDSFRDGGNSLCLLEEWHDILAFNKPAGLPVQSGTNHEDSVCSRLANTNAFFNPAPAHRLDKDTSGVLLAGATFAALRKLQENFRAAKIHKEYLAWVDGLWPWKEDVLLKHFLRREKKDGITKTRVYTSQVPYGREALSIVRLLAVKGSASLVQLRILTGRTHQIRAQLSFSGFPVYGDGKYGRTEKQHKLYLHALRLILPEGHEFSCIPEWENEFAVTSMPPPITDILLNS